MVLARRKAQEYTQGDEKNPQSQFEAPGETLLNLAGEADLNNPLDIDAKNQHMALIIANHTMRKFLQYGIRSVDPFLLRWAVQESKPKAIKGHGNGPTFIQIEGLNPELI